MHAQLMGLYEALRREFGPREWWPADTPFEVMVGAILTQRTNWQNVEKAMERLRAAGALDVRTLAGMSPEQMHELVRPAGYYRQKSARLSRLARWFWERAEGDPQRLATRPTDDLREELLSLRGIGPETADSILLYALERPSFVVDSYTNRAVVRHGLLEPGCGYYELKELFEANLPADIDLYQDYHAQLVELGKRFCGTRPRCAGCPARAILGEPIPDEELR
ncbi:MAG: endonuclease III domain-containing protein [Planctomycetes bacterium]|nr:endonuclease III domain-containing protein [Planctomycetota bacterium]